jgi:hypothetical protein
MVTRYLAALLGWGAGGLAAPVAMTAALAVAVAAICEGASDCSWGFEFVLVLPVLAGCFFVAGPRLVGRFIARRVDPSLSRRASRTTTGSAAVALFLLYLGAGSGLAGFSLMLLVVTVGVPAVVAWRTGERRS